MAKWMLMILVVAALPLSSASAQKWVRDNEIDAPYHYALGYEAEPARLAEEAERRRLSDSELAEVAGNEYARFSFVVARLDARREGGRFATTERLPGQGDLWLTRAAEKLAYAGDEVRTDAWKWAFYDEFGRYALDASVIATEGQTDPQLEAWARLDGMNPRASYILLYYDRLKEEPPGIEARIDYLVNAYRLDVGYDTTAFVEIVSMGKPAREILLAKLRDAHERGEDVRWIASMAIAALGAVGDPRVREVPRSWLPTDRPSDLAYFSSVVDGPVGTVQPGMTIPGAMLGWSGCLDGYGPFPGPANQRRPSQDAWERAHPAAKANRATDARP